MENISQLLDLTEDLVNLPHDDTKLIGSINYTKVIYLPDIKIAA